jgi:hypothetical protein
VQHLFEFFVRRVQQKTRDLQGQRRDQRCTAEPAQLFSGEP